MKKTNWLQQIENTKTVFNFMLKDVDETYMVNYFIRVYSEQKPNGNFWADLCEIGSDYYVFEKLINVEKIDLTEPTAKAFFEQENDDWLTYLGHENEFLNHAANSISEHKKNQRIRKNLKNTLFFEFLIENKLFDLVKETFENRNVNIVFLPYFNENGHDKDALMSMFIFGSSDFWYEINTKWHTYYKKNK